MNDDPKKIWQSQPTSTRSISMMALHEKTRNLRANTRLRLLGGLAGPAVVGMFYAYSIRSFPALNLYPAFVLAGFWSLAGTYFLHRGIWSGDERPADPGLTSGLVYCRREVQRQRDLESRQPLWTLGPVYLSIGVFVYALALVSTGDRGMIPNGLPFLAAVVVWPIAHVVGRLRDQRRMTREIEELDRIERENGVTAAQGA
jgi:hypothetical protein